MTSKAQYLAAAALFAELANAQPDDPPPPPPPPPPSPFTNKSYYPGQLSIINLVDTQFAPDATEVHIKVTLDRPTAITVFTRVTVQYTAPNFGNCQKSVTFYPGDPLEQTIRVPVLRKIAVGTQLKVAFNGSQVGANIGKNSVSTCVEGATPTEPIVWTGRAPRTFNPTGTLQFDLDVPNMKWRDGGSPTEWNTAFVHGRVQPANGESGLYADGSLWPDIEPPHRIEGVNLILHSQKFAAPVRLGTTQIYDYGAAVLTGHKIPETQILFGAYEWEMKTTSRPGSWPALWLLGVNGWPPEVDVYEGFGQNGSFNLATMTATNLHGGPRNNGVFVKGGNHVAIDAGFAPTLNTEFHKYQVTLDLDYITWFVDGIEVFQAINPFLVEKWYPLMNVAVVSAGAYNIGSGDMAVRSFKVWAAQ
jgi:hypothetical protein